MLPVAAVFWFVGASVPLWAPWRERACEQTDGSPPDLSNCGHFLLPSSAFAVRAQSECL